MSPLTLFLDLLHRSSLALLLLLPAVAFSITVPLVLPPMSDSERGIARVSDPHAALRHEERAVLEGRLAELWRRTGLKVAVVIDSPDNEWESLTGFAQRLAVSGGLSARDAKPGGVLLVVDPQAQQAALRVSTELAGAFTPAEIERILAASVNPLLRQGRLAQGVEEGVKRIAAVLDQPKWVNRSLFARGYGIAASFGLFLGGLLLRRRWGALKSATAAALSFALLVCIDGFTLGFPWYGVLFCAALSALFLGLFVWIGTGSDAPAGSSK